MATPMPSSFRHDGSQDCRMTFVVAQISDSHLGGAGGWFAPTFAKLAHWLNANPPDLVVHTGDVTLDGVASDHDFDAAARLMKSIDTPVRCIPGNHDIGEGLYPGVREPPVTPQRLAAWREHFGPDIWIEDREGWRLIGVNAQLFGGGLDEEAAQYEFVRDAASSAGDRRLALFSHKPLFDRAADETIVGGRFVNPKPRKRLLDAFAGHPASVVGSGHVHQFRLQAIDGATHVWAPSASFTFPDRLQPILGEKIVGYVEHRFEADGRHFAMLKSVPGLATEDLDCFPDAYNQL